VGPLWLDVAVAARTLNSTWEASVHQTEYDTLDETIDIVARHAAKALLALDEIRRSYDPSHRAAYRQVHDLIGDLGGMKIQLAGMSPERIALALEWEAAQSSRDAESER